MTTLFYLLVIFIVIVELLILTVPQKLTLFSLNLKEKNAERDKAKKEGRAISKKDEEEYRDIAIRAFILFTYTIFRWVIMFVGLMSFYNWPIFLIMVLLPLIVTVILNINRNSSWFRTSLTVFSTTIRVALLLFAIINHYHLHINLIEIIKK